MVRSYSLRPRILENLPAWIIHWEENNKSREKGCGKKHWPKMPKTKCPPQSSLTNVYPESNPTRKRHVICHPAWQWHWHDQCFHLQALSTVPTLDTSGRKVRHQCFETVLGEWPLPWHSRELRATSLMLTTTLSQDHINFLWAYRILPGLKAENSWVW